MTSIDKARITAVRGIRAELTLDLGGRHLLLRGDNGSGKSSIAQALQWALIGALSSSTALPPEFQRHKLEGDHSACQVILDLLPKGRIVMKGGKLDEAATDADGHAYVEACVRSNPFLRRDELLGILSDSPGDRFRYFEGFLDQDRVDRMLAALAPLAKQHEVAAKDAESARVRLLASAMTHLPGAQPPAQGVGDLISRLVALATSLGFAANDGAGFDALAPLREALGSTIAKAAGAARRDELGRALERMRTLVPPDHPRSILTPLHEAEQRAAETDLAALLEDALEVVDKRPSLECCPLCEQPVDAADLAARLRTRMAFLVEVRDLKAGATDLGRGWQDFLVSLDGLERIANGEPATRSSYPSGRALLDQLDQSGGDTLAARVLQRIEALRLALTTEHDSIPNELRAAEIEKLAAGIDATLATRAALERSEAEHARHTTAARHLRAVEKAVGDARKDVAADILKSIGALVATYYERIHPRDAADEVTGAPRIKVKRHGAGTAHVFGLFNEEEIADPRLVYSDGHLDTVGICIFLALRKRAEGKAKLLVLDDIVLSIDMGHAHRLIDLLSDEFGDHQIILLSHNELLMRICRERFSNARRLEIHSWTLERGPRIVGHVSGIERLRTQLDESGSAGTVANAMGPVIDDLLKAACPAFEVSIPSTRTRGLTIDERWGPLKKKLVETAKAGAVPDLTAILEKIGSPSFFRNALGAHSNDWALDATLGQLQRVAAGVLELVGALQCATCNTVVHPKNPRDLSQGLACECRGGASPTLSSSKTKES
jgi:energy-coupling factor transporter ATP-binding protein EcfA2